MKFAVWTLVAASILSLLALLIGEMLPPQAAGSSLVQTLELTDPFHSRWFRLLLGLLSLSLAVCVIERTPIMLRQAFSNSFISNPNQFSVISKHVRETTNDGVKRAEEVFQRLGMPVQRRETPAGVALSGARGGVSRLGPLLSHFGFLLLLAGGLVVSLTGTARRVVGSPGQVLELPEWDFQLRIDEFIIEYYPVKLNMWVESDDGRRGKVEEIKGDSARVAFGLHSGGTSSAWFEITKLRTDFETLDDDGDPTPYQGNVKSYISDVTVIEDGRESRRFKIAVNHPLRERGFRFYQSSFQAIAGAAAVDSLVIRYEGEEGRGEAVVKTGDGRTPLPFGGYYIETPEFYPDFRLNEDFQPFTASQELRNPAARIRLLKGDSTESLSWAFRSVFPHMGKTGPLTFSIADVRGVQSRSGGYATVLEVNRDRGGPLIWAGFLAATLGLMLTYTMTHRQVWALVVKRPDGREDLHLAGASARGGEHFAARWEAAVRRESGEK